MVHVVVGLAHPSGRNDPAEEVPLRVVHGER